MEFVATFISVVQIGISALGKLDNCSLDALVERAVAAVHPDSFIAWGFDDHDILREDLRQWARRELPNLIESILKGETPSPESVMESIDKLCAEDDDKKKLVEVFLGVLKKELLSNPSSMGQMLYSQSDINTQVTIKSIEQLTDRVDAVIAGAGEVSQRMSSDQELIRARLMDAAALVDEGETEAAIKQLKRIEKEESGKFNAELKFLVSHNLGVAYIYMREFDLAREQFELAAQFGSDNETLIRNRIKLAMSEQDEDLVLSLVNEEKNRGFRKGLVPVILEGLIRFGRIDEALHIAPSQEEANSEELIALAEVHLASEDYDAAIRAIDLALALSPNMCFAQYKGGVARIEKAIDKSQGFAFVDDDIRGILVEAKDKFERSSELAEAQKFPMEKSYSLFYLGLIEQMIGSIEKAIELYEQSNDGSFLSAESALNRGILLFSEGRWNESVSDLDVALEVFPEKAKLFLFVALVEIDAIERAVHLIENLWHKDSSSEADVGLACALIMNSEKSDFVQFSNQAEEFLDKCSREGFLLATVVLTRNELIKGNKDKARSLLEQVDISGAANTGVSDRILVELASLHAVLGEVTASNFALDNLRGMEALSTALKLRVQNCFSEGDHVSAYKHASQYILENEFDIDVWIVQSQLLMQLLRMGEAAQLFGELHEHTRNLEYAIHRTHCLFLDGDREAALEVAGNIDAEDESLSPDLRMQLAHILAELDDSRAVEVAYQAARQARSDDRVQLGYFQLFAQQEGDYVAIKVAPGTAVLTSSGSQESWHLMLEDGELARRRSDINQNSEFGKILLGKSIGDEIKVLSGRKIVSRKIVDIQSKYVRLFQEIIAEFSGNFPASNLLHPITLKEDDLSELHDVFRDNSQRIQDAVDQVVSNAMPCSAFAFMTGRHIFKSTYYLLRNRDVPSRVADKSVKSTGVIKAEKFVALDISALVTAQHIGLLDKLGNSKLKVVITPQVRGELLQAHKEISSAIASSTLYGDGESLEIVEADDKEYDRQMLGNLSGILEFVDFACEVVDSPIEMLKFTTGDSKEEKLLGYPSLSAILYSQEADGIFISDEYLTKAIAEQKFKVATQDTFALIEFLVGQDILSANEMYEHIVELLRLQYKGIPISDSRVCEAVEMLRESNSEAAVIFVQAAVESTAISDQEAVLLVASLLKIMAFDADHGISRYGVMNNILLGLRNRGDFTFRSAINVARSNFLLTPIQWSKLKDYIATWCTVHNCSHLYSQQYDD